MSLPLPNQSGGIEALMTGECAQSWVPKCANFVFGSDVSPGIDLVVLLESSDGLLNELRVILGVPGKPDAPGIIQQGGAACRLSVLWNKVEIVNRVLLAFPSHSSLSSFLLQLVSAFSHLENDTISASATQQQDEMRPTGIYHAEPYLTVDFEVIHNGESLKSGVHLLQELADELNPVAGEVRTDDKSKRFFCSLLHRGDEWDLCSEVKILAVNHNSPGTSYNGLPILSNPERSSAAETDGLRSESSPRDMAADPLVSCDPIGTTCQLHTLNDPAQACREASFCRTVETKPSEAEANHCASVAQPETQNEKESN